jgi:hypothetical protein
MLCKTIFATVIVILATMGAASAQEQEDLDHIRAGENSLRTDQEKNNDIAVDRAYRSTIQKTVPEAKKKNPDPWADVRPNPPSAAAKKSNNR